MHPELRRELWVILFLTLVGAVVGDVSGDPLAGVSVVLGLYVFLQLNKLRRLYRWLRGGRTGAIPELGGMWDEVIREVHRNDRDSERHKERISGLFDRLQAAASAMPDAMVVLSQRDLIEWANPPAERLLGLHAQRDIGARLVHLIRDPALTVYLEGGDYHEPLILKGSVGPYVISVQIIPFGASQKLIIGRDITHLIKLEDMRSHFVADVSHELRTPLTVLRGFLETFQDIFGEQDGELRANLAFMQEQVDRMRRLVDDLLALSRLETTPARTHEEQVDVSRLAANLRDVALALSGDRGHQVVVETSGDALIGNFEELRSAFTNLVHNAVRHTPPGGSIRITWTTDAHGGRLCVHDTGEGIAARHIPFLTERFYRVDSGRSRATGG
ncbi:MAG: phosphate regulon sensor histidine kinase PhoR, partial [Acidiferrobacter sp.]